MYVSKFKTTIKTIKCDPGWLDAFGEKWPKM
jgi:hypothetical protein